MDKTIDYQGKRIHYTIFGDGDALLFLHGYLESGEIWKDFIFRFAKTHKVVSIDIPGHGKSEVLGETHTMDQMATVVCSVLDAEKIEKVCVFGHSMGGYIVMEFVKLFPEKTMAYCLFHSTCFADDEEKKLNRDREISLVMCGKKMQIIHTNIPKAFAESSLEKLPDELKKAKEIAALTPDNGIIALLRGMKERKDHSEILMNTEYSPLLIWGKKDNYIGEEVFKRLLALAPHASVIILKESGHMGFIEEADCVYSGIINYLDDIKFA